MALFQYPKSKHTRTLTPRIYRQYRSYKRILQTEFSRVCVYCRQPDSSAPNLSFGIDHYRPKGIPRFSNLICEYKNLYYCCGGCNSRKNDYWPTNEKTGPFVVAPCEHVMTQHLWFNSNNGKIETRTKEGEFTEELLQLNHAASVGYRIATLKTVSLYLLEIQKHESELKTINQMLHDRKISQDQFNTEMAAINKELDELRFILESYTGELPIPALQKKRLGVSLFE